MKTFLVWCVCFVAFLSPKVARSEEPLKPFRIQVVDEETGWPVPLVELRTTQFQRFVTDNAGVIAMNAAELMGKETWFTVIGHGYELRKDAFGMHGFRIRPQSGGHHEVKIKRVNVAKRMGRVTGSGLFAESQWFGEHLDWEDSPVVGCDSVQNAVYQGKYFWAWGDTNWAKYPLGVFHTTSATTPLQTRPHPEPPLKLSLNYFLEKPMGNMPEDPSPKAVARMPGDGPTWVSGYVSLKDQSGKEHLVCSYVKIRNMLEAYESGLLIWNDAESRFQHVTTLWKIDRTQTQKPAMPEGHPLFWRDEAGIEWVLYGDPLPKLRHPATLEAWKDPSTWEILEPQKKLRAISGQEMVEPHSGSVAWSDFRKRWVTVFVEKFGKPSDLGEVWYAESENPTGPWGPAIKILTHDNYTFYNPRIHADWLSSDSPILFFEGTYTQTFSKNKEATPRYEYNQMMYRLDLNDPMLRPVQSDVAEVK